MAEALQELATQFVDGSRSTWAYLVKLALGLTDKQVPNGAKRLAELTGTSEKSVKVKITAIRYAQKSGMSEEEIIAKGQKAILSRDVKARNGSRHEKLVCFPHKVTAECRDDLKALCVRLCQTLGFKTYDQCFYFIAADYVTLSDAELKHLAGKFSTFDAPGKLKKARTNGSR